MAQLSENPRRQEQTKELNSTAGAKALTAGVTQPGRARAQSLGVSLRLSAMRVNNTSSGVVTAMCEVFQLRARLFPTVQGRFSER